MTSTLHHAYAKINLGLNVLGKRPDGYHDIESIFMEVDLCDDVRVSIADTLTVECEPPVTASMLDNLVYKAADALRTALSMPDKGAKIAVTKRIPTGGGLGGGSSDAAATLMALYELWTNTSPSTPQAQRLLMPIAAGIGSDVPFFLEGGVAYVTGRGEHIAPLRVQVPWTVLLLLPGIHIHTPTAYSTLGITDQRAASGLDKWLAQAIETQELLAQHFTNDFERVVFAQHPVLSTYCIKLREQGAVYASMSGSGSTIFGLFTSVENATTAASAFPTVPTYICRPIQRH